MPRETPEYERYARETYEREGENIISKLVDRVEVLNLDRVSGLKVARSPILYTFNHVSQADYFAPVYVILKEGLPYPRTVAGSNLKHPSFVKYMCDFEKWGVIWHDRTDKSPVKMLRFSRVVKRTLQSGGAVLAFLEGGINRCPERGLGELKEEFLRMVPPETLIVCGAEVYDSVLEKEYWDRIDKDGFGSDSYFYWFLHSYLKRVEKQTGEKGGLTVNFARPVSCLELSGGGSEKQKSARCARRIKLIIEDLLGEVENHSPPISVAKNALFDQTS